jgi:hypothetical protein
VEGRVPRDTIPALTPRKPSNAPALNAIWAEGSNREGRGNLKAFKGLARAPVNLVSAESSASDGAHDVACDVALTRPPLFPPIATQPEVASMPGLRMRLAAIKERLMRKRFERKQTRD